MLKISDSNALSTPSPTDVLHFNLPELKGSVICKLLYRLESLRRKEKYHSRSHRKIKHDLIVNLIKELRTSDTLDWYKDVENMLKHEVFSKAVHDRTSEDLAYELEKAKEIILEEWLGQNEVYVHPDINSSSPKQKMNSLFQQLHVTHQRISQINSAEEAPASKTNRQDRKLPKYESHPIPNILIIPPHPLASPEAEKFPKHPTESSPTNGFFFAQSNLYTNRASNEATEKTLQAYARSIAEFEQVEEFNKKFDLK